MKRLKIQLKKGSPNPYIQVGKYIKIPCTYQGTRYYRVFDVCGFTVTVIFSDVEGVMYVYPFNKSSLHFSFKVKKKSMKDRHYKELKHNNYSHDYILNEIYDVTYKKLGYSVNIYSPKTFNEKILWIKLNEKDPLITKCCDKYAVKEYVKDVVGEKFTLKVLKTWTDPSEINFDDLPNQFVLKVNWSSGYNIIVKDKEHFNKYAAIKLIEKWILPQCNSYYHFFNYGYKDVKPVIFAEPYIEEDKGRLNDYKLFINNGELIFVLMASGRYGQTEESLSYYDANLNKFPFTRGRKNNEDIKKPDHFELMVDLAIKLAQPFKFVRVDFFEDDKHNVYVGEMTFYTAGGLTRFNPPEWDLRLGEMINL